MLGAIVGDYLGSPYEGTKGKRFIFPLFSKKCRFTDDTILTVATAYSILTGLPYKDSYKKFAQDNISVGYGARFKDWALNFDEPYNSYGNGSAMRVSPIGWAYNDEAKVLEEARKSAMCTHNHPEGIKGAQATAFTIFLARNGHTKKQILNIINKMFGYDI